MFKLFSQSVESVVGSALGISNPDDSYNEKNHKPKPKPRSASPIEAKKTQRLTKKEREELFSKCYEDAYSDLRTKFDEFLSSMPTNRRFSATGDYMPPIDILTMNEIIEKDAKNKAAEDFNAKVVNPYYDRLERSQPNPEPKSKTKQHHNTYSRPPPRSYASPPRSPPRSYASPPRSPPRSYSRSQQQSVDDLKVLGLDQNSSDIGSIKKAYHLLVKQNHPDKQVNKSIKEQSDAEINIRKINDAYENLIGKNAGLHKKTIKKQKQQKTKRRKYNNKTK